MCCDVLKENKVLSKKSKWIWSISPFLFSLALTEFFNIHKALSKQEGSNVYWDTRFLNPFIEF